MNRQGLYIHIPFCKSRCVYCDFYSTTCGAKSQDYFTKALRNEAVCRAHYLTDNTVDSVYIGGGTPSALSCDNLQKVFDTIHDSYEIRPDGEVTVEVNPNDVTPQLADMLRRNGVNRISMGIQSFDDKTLRFLHRRHTAAEAIKAVDTIIDGGIGDLSIDLIYGLPGQTAQQWSDDVDKALALPINHLSAYALTYEEGTPLYKMLKKGSVSEADDMTSLCMFLTLMNKAGQRGFVHYEISNFALPGKQARHNSGYWEGMRYIGLGPGAHSFDGASRQQNIGDLEAYVKAYTDTGDDHARQEVIIREQLSPAEQREEYIMTSLRTAHGIDLADFCRRFGDREFRKLVETAAAMIEDRRLVVVQHRLETFCETKSRSNIDKLSEGNIEGLFLTLPATSIFVSDDIISSLF